MKIMKNLLVVGLLLISRVGHASEQQLTLIQRAQYFCKSYEVMYATGYGIAIVGGYVVMKSADLPHSDYGNFKLVSGLALVGLGVGVAGYSLRKMDEKKRAALIAERQQRSLSNNSNRSSESDVFLRGGDNL